MNAPLNAAFAPTLSPALAAGQPDSPGLAGASRIGVLVLGMHRSGTSALTRMLNLLGCSLPHTLLGGNETNPSGHWESEEVMRFNDELLALAGSSWDDWLPIGEGFFAAPGYRELVARGAELLRAEFGSAPLFVFKDPRNCRLARFWLDVFASEAITPAVVIPIRNPIEVARSLTTRNHADEHYGPLLWLRHVLDAEAASRGTARVFTSYDQMVDCWEVVAGRLQAGLGLAWPRMSAATQEEIAAFIDQRHRHEIAPPEAILRNPMVSDWLRRSYEILNRWAQDGESAADHAELDAIAQAFTAAVPAFARLVLHGTRARQRVSELEAALAKAEARTAQIEAEAAQQLHAQHEALTQQTAQAWAECTGLRAQIDELAGMRDAAEGKAAALEARTAELALLLGEARTEAGASTALRAQIDELAGMRDAAKGKVASLEARTAELARELAETQAKAEAASQQLRETQRRLAEQENRAVEQESALIQRREENEQAWAALAQEQAASADLRRELVDAAQREETHRQRLADAEAWVFRLAEERQAAQRDAHSAKAAQATAEQRADAAKVQVLLAQAAVAEANRSKELATELDTKHREAEAQLRALLAEQEKSEGDLRHKVGEAAKLTTALQHQEAEAERQRHLAKAEAARGDELEAKQREAQTQLRTLRAEQEKAEGSVRDRFGEVAMLTTMVRQHEAQEGRQMQQVEWLRQVSVELATRPKWWALMPRGWQRKRHNRRWKSRGLFDGEAYLTAHPDVRIAGMDPLRHYLLHGYAEGRIPTVTPMIAKESADE